MATKNNSKQSSETDKKESPAVNLAEVNRFLQQVKDDLELKKKEKELVKKYFEEGNFDKSIHEYMKENKEWFRMMNKSTVRRTLSNNQKETEQINNLINQLNKIKRNPSNEGNKQLWQAIKNKI